MRKEFVDKVEPTRPWPPAPLPDETQKKHEKGPTKDKKKVPIGDECAKRLLIE